MRTRRLLALVTILAVLLTTACTDDSAAQESALRDKAATLTDRLAETDWTAVREDFDETMRVQLQRDDLQAAWEQVTRLRGEYRSRGEPTRVHKPGDFVVFDTPMEFERGPMKSRITFRPDGQVAGLFVLFPEVD